MGGPVKIAPKSATRIDLPPLRALGEDLLNTTRRERAQILLRPFLAVLLFSAAAWFGWWPVCLAAIGILHFSAYFSTAHDLVHGTLRLPKRATDILLMVVQLLVLQSGHAYRISHLHHHRAFPHSSDAEGNPAHHSLWRVLLEGPLYILRVTLASWKNAGKERRWIMAETIFIALFIAVCLALGDHAPWICFYAATVILGSWLYPLVGVYVPHYAGGTNALFHTRAFRGRLIPALLLQHTYHLEHHLYPQVPTPRWAELARRLDTFLTEKGVQPIRLI